MIILVSVTNVQVMQEIMDNNIRIYSGEIDEEEDSPEIKELRVMGCGRTKALSR